MKRFAFLFLAVSLAYAAQTGLRSPAFVASLAPRASGGGGAGYMADLIAYYALEDATDSHTSHFDLTENGTVSYVAGINANDADLGTGPGYLSRATDFDLNAKSYTVSLWFRSPDPTTAQTAWAWEGFGGIALRISGSATLWHYDGGWKSAADGTSLDVDTWYHIVSRYDAGTDELSIFVNGNKTTSSSVGDANASSSPVFYLGNEGWGNQCNGMIGECAVWYRALDDAEVGNLYNAGTGLFYAGF